AGESELGHVADVYAVFPCDLLIALASLRVDVRHQSMHIRWYAGLDETNITVLLFPDESRGLGFFQRGRQCSTDQQQADRDGLCQCLENLHGVLSLPRTDRCRR